MVVSLMLEKDDVVVGENDSSTFHNLFSQMSQQTSLCHVIVFVYLFLSFSFISTCLIK